jgi:hypothetical protein
MAGPLPNDATERPAKERELTLSPDKRRVQVSGDRRSSQGHRDQPEGEDGLRLALQGQRLRRLDLDRVADQPEGGLAQQDLARWGGLLQPGRRVHSVAGDQGLPARRISSHDLPGVHAGPHEQ